MNRDIKFRAWDTFGKLMKSWGYVKNNFDMIDLTDGKFIPLQYTGIRDKNNRNICEGDIIEYYTFGRYVQQSHSDIPPEIDEPYIKKVREVVKCIDGCFLTDSCYDEYIITTLNSLGLENIGFIKDHVFGENRKEIYSEEEMEGDINGTIIDESILGIKIIGNKFENPELLK